MRSVMGQDVIVGEGAKQVNFNKLITLNPSAAYLWKSVEGKDFTINDIADLLQGKYDIDAATAQADAKDIVDKWMANGLVE